MKDETIFRLLSAALRHSPLRDGYARCIFGLPRLFARDRRRRLHHQHRTARSHQPPLDAHGGCRHQRIDPQPPQEKPLPQRVERVLAGLPGAGQPGSRHEPGRQDGVGRCRRARQGRSKASASGPSCPTASPCWPSAQRYRFWLPGASGNFRFSHWKSSSFLSFLHIGVKVK